MKEAIVKKGPKVEIIDSDIPKPGPGQVVTKVVFSGSNRMLHLQFLSVLPLLSLLTPFQQRTGTFPPSSLQTPRHH